MCKGVVDLVADLDKAQIMLRYATPQARGINERAQDTNEREAVETFSSNCNDCVRLSGITSLLCLLVSWHTQI